MKKNYLIYGLVLSALIALSISMVNSCSNVDDSAAEKARELIKVNRIRSNVIIISLASDAVTAVNTQDGILVIDAGISNSLTTIYRRMIEKEFQRNDFAYLINTHSHWDHTGGNQVFPDAVIIGQENCITEINRYWKEKEKIKNSLKKIIDEYDNKIMNLDPEWQDSLDIYSQKLRYQCAYNDLVSDRVITLPTETLKDSMTINLGDISLELIYYGRAHSGSDILIYIPELKLLFTGDLFSGGEEMTYESDESSETGWRLVVKEWLGRRINHIETIIRGHGEIINKEKADAFIRRSTDL